MSLSISAMVRGTDVDRRSRWDACLISLPSMTARDVRLLLDYHYWARDRLLDAVQRLSADALLQDRGSSFRSIRDTLAHMYFAERAWYSRWQGASPTALPDASQFEGVSALRDAWRTLELELRAFVASLSDTDLTRGVDYRLLSGVSAASPFWQMIQHVVNHATYHRGQVVTMLRQAGQQPPLSTDLITFYRELPP